MQTTLLGLAIALILALVTALVGPHFIDWTDHRARFEAEASRLVGLDVRVGGPIDVRLLPVPWVSLGGIEIGPQEDGRRLRARSLGVALELGALMRGEVRAAEMRLSGPEFGIGLDGKGRVEWPAISLDAGKAMAIERLTIEDGRVVLSDARSAGRAVLQNVQFSGEVRSLVGPLRGEGAFLSGGRLYGYRLAVGRMGDDGLRLRLSLDTPDEPFTLNTEGQFTTEDGAPRYEGTLAVARPADPEHPEGGGEREPMQITGKVALGDDRAVFQQIEFNYGPQERALRLSGAAELRLGKQPRLQGALSARQIDLDKLIAAQTDARRPPLSVVEGFSDMFAKSLRPPVPANLAISIDALTLGGAVLHQVGADLRADGSQSKSAGWQLDRLEFRAPGFTQVRLSGRLDASGSLGFSGAANIDSNDPRALVAWLSGSEPGATQFRPWRISGDVTLDQAGIAIERLRTAFERGTVEGRLNYRWVRAEQPATLDADLKAGEIDVDAVLAFAKNAFSESGFDAPREVRLALEAEQVRIAGFDARTVRARGSLDGAGIAVDHLSVADFGDAAFEARGRIETGAKRGGVLTVDLDAKHMAGVIALAERFAPALASPVRRLSAGGGAKLKTIVSLEQNGDDRASGRLALVGRLGAIGIDIAGAAEGGPESFALNDPSALKSTQVRFDGSLAADRAADLLALAGLDRIAIATAPGTKAPDAEAEGQARLTFSVAGPANGELSVEARLAGPSMTAEAEGTARLAGSDPAGKDSVGKQPAVLAFKSLSGTLAGRSFEGALTARFAAPVQLDGTFRFDAIDVPGAIAAAMGMPERAGDGTIWTKEPFRHSLSDLAGRVAFSAPRAAFGPDLQGRDLRGVARFRPMQVTFEDVSAQVAGGKVSGRLALAEGPDGLSLRLRTHLSSVDATALLARGKGPSPISGRLTLETELEGSGLSPAAFVGSLAGHGKVTLADGRIGGLNPHAFDALLRAVDLGIPTDTARIRDFMATALDNGSLPVKRATADLAIAAGQARLANVSLSAPGAEVGLSGLYDLASDTIDASLSLTGAMSSEAIAKDGLKDGLRPVVFVFLRGPADAPTRQVDATTLTGWLALRAVEQQAKKLEEMEKRAREIQRQRAEEAKRRQAEEAKRREAQEAEDRRQADERRAAEERRKEEERRKAKQESDARKGQGAQPAMLSPPLVPDGEATAKRAPPLPPALTIPPPPARPNVPGAATAGEPLNLLGNQN